MEWVRWGPLASRVHSLRVPRVPQVSLLRPGKTRPHRRRKRARALTLPLPRLRRPSPRRTPAVPAIAAPSPTAPPGSAPASSSPAQAAASCPPQAEPAPWCWAGLLSVPSPSADRQAPSRSGPPACPQPAAVALCRPCAPILPVHVSGSPIHVASYWLYCLSSLSPSLSSTPAVLRPSLRHFRPRSTDPRARSKGAWGNPAPESPHHRIVRIVFKEPLNKSQF